MLAVVIRGLVVSAALLSTTSISAAPIEFGCDVPPDRFSSVSHGFDSPMVEIRGSVRVIEMRTGHYLPVAGARFDDISGNNGVGFQLVAPSRKAKELDVFVNVEKDGQVKRFSAGKVAATGSISFKIALGNTGAGKFSIGQIEFTVEAPPIARGKAQAFCSTGEFEFSGLEFVDSGTVS